MLSCLRPTPFFWPCNRTDATEGRQVLIIKQHHLTPLPPSLHPWHHTTGPATYSSTRVPDEPVRTPRAKSEQRVRQHTLTEQHQTQHFKAHLYSIREQQQQQLLSPTGCIVRPCAPRIRYVRAALFLSQQRQAGMTRFWV